SSARPTRRVRPMPSDPKPSPGQLLIDAVRARRPARAERRSVGVNFTPEMNDLLVIAAQQRDISLSSYVRRAAMAVAALDLRLEWEDVTRTEGQLRSFDQSEFRPGRGDGAGPW